MINIRKWKQLQSCGESKKTADENDADADDGGNDDSSGDGDLDWWYLYLQKMQALCMHKQTDNTYSSSLRRHCMMIEMMIVMPVVAMVFIPTANASFRQAQTHVQHLL